MGEGTGSVPDLARNRAEALALMSVSHQTTARLDRFVALLLDWQRRTNLIAASTLPHIWTRHIADSAQLLPLAPQAKTWIDLGSGAGFPGVVIACALADTPGAMVHLIESTGKKCAFLREAVQQIGLPAAVHCQRIEQFTSEFSGSADVVTGRALAPLPRLLELAAPLLKTPAVGLFPKGQDVARELTESSKCWTFNYEIVPSVTSPASGVIRLCNLRTRFDTPREQTRHG